MIVIILKGAMVGVYYYPHLVTRHTMFPMFPMVGINIRLALGVY